MFAFNRALLFVLNKVTTTKGSVVKRVLIKSYRNRYGSIDWRDLAILTSIGATLGVHYAKTGRPFFLSNQ